MAFMGVATYLSNLFYSNYELSKNTQLNLSILNQTNELINDLQKNRIEMTLNYLKIDETEHPKILKDPNPILDSIIARIHLLGLTPQSLDNVTLHFNRARIETKSADNYNQILTKINLSISHLTKAQIELGQKINLKEVSTHVNSISILQLAKESAANLSITMAHIVKADEPISFFQINNLLTLKSGMDANIISPSLKLSNDGHEKINKIVESEGWALQKHVFNMIFALAESGNYEINTKEFIVVELDLITQISAIMKSEFILIEGEVQSIQKSSFQRLLVLLGTLIVLLSILIVFSRQVIIGITRPLNQAVKAIDNLSKGDLTTILIVKSEDEIGQIAKALNKAITGMKETLNTNSVDWEILAQQKKREKEIAEEIATTKEATAEMLNNMKQAIFTFDQDLKINEHYSLFLYKILGKNNPVGLDSMKFLFEDSDANADELRIMNFYVSNIFGADELQWSLSSNEFITEYKKEIEGSWRDVKLILEPIYDVNKAIRRIIAVVEDVTEINKMTKEAKEQQKKLEKLSQLLAIDDGVFDSFIEEISVLFEDCHVCLQNLRNCAKENKNTLISHLYRYVHTIKGNARLFKLASILDLSHELENYLTELRSDEVEYHEDAEENIHEKIEAIKCEVDTYIKLRRGILKPSTKKYGLSFAKLKWIRSMFAQYTQALCDGTVGMRERDRMQDELEKAISSLENATIEDYVPNYDDMIRTISSDRNKKIKPLILDLEHKYFSAILFTRVNEIILHSLRNAIDHGIETPEERIKNGKDAEAE